eukprot:3803270-Pyramimonas_sp.AAC.1
MARPTLRAESASMSVDSSMGQEDLVVGTIAARDVHGPHPGRVGTCWAPPQADFRESRNLKSGRAKFRRPEKNTQRVSASSEVFG